MSSDSDIEILDDDVPKGPKAALPPTAWAQKNREPSVQVIEPRAAREDSVIADSLPTREDEASADGAALLDCIQITPEHIRGNGTLHTTPFHGIAELIDNAVDSGAKMVKIENHGSDSSRYITVTDDGEGMNRTDALKTILVGFSMKRGDAATIGQFGNGLKSGSMRLGETMLLATKKGEEFTVLMISLPYLEKTNNHKCYAPCISYRQETAGGELKPLLIQGEKADKHTFARNIILEYSPFQQEEDLHDFLKERIPGATGTCVAIKDLKKLENGQFEMRSIGGDFVCVDRAVPELLGTEIHDNSLSKFLQTLYIEPKIVCYIQDRQVRFLDVRRTLACPRWKLLNAEGMQCFKEREQEKIKKEVTKLENERSSLKTRQRELTTQLSYQFDKETAADERRLRMDVEKYDKKIAALQSRKLEQIGAQIRVYFGIDLIDRCNPRMMLFSNGRRILTKSLINQNKGKHAKDGFRAVMGVVAIVDIPSTLLPTMQSRENFAIPSELDMIAKTVNALARTYLKHADARYKTGLFWYGLGYESALVEEEGASIHEEITRRRIGEIIGWRRQCAQCGEFREVPEFSDLTQTLDETEFTCENVVVGGCFVPKTREELKKERIEELDESGEPTFYSEGKEAETRADIEKKKKKEKEKKEAEAAKKVTSLVRDQPLVGRKKSAGRHSQLSHSSSRSSREHSLESRGGRAASRAEAEKAKKRFSFSGERSDSDYSPPAPSGRTLRSIPARSYAEPRAVDKNHQSHAKKSDKKKKQEKEKQPGRHVRSEMGVSFHPKIETDEDVEEEEEASAPRRNRQEDQGDDDPPYEPLLPRPASRQESMVMAKEEEAEVQLATYTSHPSRKKMREQEEARERQRRREEAEYLAGERLRFGSLAPTSIGERGGVESSDRGTAIYTASSEALDMANMTGKDERKRKGEKCAAEATKKKRDGKDSAAATSSFESTAALIDGGAVGGGGRDGGENAHRYANMADSSLSDIYDGNYVSSPRPAYDNSLLGGMHDDPMLVDDTLQGAPVNRFMTRDERLAALQAMDKEEMIEKHLGLQDALNAKIVEVMQKIVEIDELKMENEDLQVQINTEQLRVHEKTNETERLRSDVERLDRETREKDEAIAKKDEEIARLKAEAQGHSSKDKEQIERLKAALASKETLIETRDALQCGYLDELANMKSSERLDVIAKLKASHGANFATIMDGKRRNGAR